ncbi:hypothetical protein TNCV_116651 [Trichonephila clavipes]|nr:hypothetical protein TNCV_116651 [Trichonephila clavipes]
MHWPARSPDINPIEPVWDFLGRRLAARTSPPVTIRELRLALQDECAAMPQQLIDTLILSMGRRLLAEVEFDRGRLLVFRACGLSLKEIVQYVGRNQASVRWMGLRWMPKETTNQPH